MSSECDNSYDCACRGSSMSADRFTVSSDKTVIDVKQSCFEMMDMNS